MPAGSHAFSFQRRYLLCQPHFLLPWQALELAFCAQCFSFAIECPGSHENNGSMGSGVMSSLPSIVQRNASLDIGGVPGIERSISAADHVDIVCLWMIHTLLLALLPCALAHRPFLVFLYWFMQSIEREGRSEDAASEQAVPVSNTISTVAFAGIYLLRHLCELAYDALERVGTLHEP